MPLLALPGENPEIKKTSRDKTSGKPQTNHVLKKFLLTVRYILEIDSDRERSAWVKRVEWGVLEEGAHKER